MEPSGEIIISYDRRDTVYVRDLYREIKYQTGGITPWVDWERIPTGDTFENNIIKAIDNAQIVIFILSKNSIESDYVRCELSYAWNRKKRICPLMIDNEEDCVRGWYLFKFGELNRTDYRDKDQKEIFFNNLRQWLDIHDSEVDILTKRALMMVGDYVPSPGLFLETCAKILEEKQISQHFNDFYYYSMLATSLDQHCRELPGGLEVIVSTWDKALSLAVDSSESAQALIYRGTIIKRMNTPSALECAKRDIEEGLSLINSERDHDLTVLGIYNMACIFGLQGHLDESIKYISQLKSITSESKYVEYQKKILNYLPQLDGVI